jgi:hypothetical protein
MNLDFMRNNRPNRAEPRVTINLPPYDYDPPEPGSGGLGGYFTQEALPKNSVGQAGKKAGEDPDPTGGNSPTGSSSINLGSQNVNFLALSGSFTQSQSYARKAHGFTKYGTSLLVECRCVLMRLRVAFPL